MTPTDFLALSVANGPKRTVRRSRPSPSNYESCLKHALLEAGALPAVDVGFFSATAFPPAIVNVLVAEKDEVCV